MGSHVQTPPNQPTLSRARRCRLVVCGIEVGGKWAPEATCVCWCGRVLPRCMISCVQPLGQPGRCVRTVPLELPPGRECSAGGFCTSSWLTHVGSMCQLPAACLRVGLFAFDDGPTSLHKRRGSSWSSFKQKVGENENLQPMPPGGISDSPRKSTGAAATSPVLLGRVACTTLRFVGPVDQAVSGGSGPWLWVQG